MHQVLSAKDWGYQFEREKRRGLYIANKLRWCYVGYGHFKKYWNNKNDTRTFDRQ